MVSVLAHLLAFLVSGFGGHLLPCFVLLLLGLVPSVLLVLHFLIATFSFFPCPCLFTLDNVSVLIIKHEVSLESIECSQDGYDVLVIGGFGSPCPPSLEVVAFAGGKGHENLTSHSCEFPIKPAIMVVADVLFEAVAGDNKVGIEQEPNRIINGGIAGQQL